MSYVTANYDGSVEGKAGRNRIFGKFSADFRHRTVKVNPDCIALTGIAEFLRNQFVRFVIHLLNPDSVCIDFCLDVAVGRAADTHTNRARSTKTDRAACTVARKADDADIVSHIFTAELCSEADFVGFLK